MTEQETTCCAHCTVKLVVIQNDQGLCHDEWKCLDCGAIFWPSSHINKDRDDKLKEIERLCNNITGGQILFFVVEITAIFGSLAVIVSKLYSH